jgi:DNA-directed RNA polymerase specialized sigma24 family protein
MKTKKMTFAEHMTFKPEDAERCAYRSYGTFGENIEVKCWTSRSALRTTIDMQDKRERRSGDWRPYKSFP